MKRIFYGMLLCMLVFACGEEKIKVQQLEQDAQAEKKEKQPTEPKNDDQKEAPEHKEKKEGTSKKEDQTDQEKKQQTAFLKLHFKGRKFLTGLSLKIQYQNEVLFSSNKITTGPLNIEVSKFFGKELTTCIADTEKTIGKGHVKITKKNSKLELRLPAPKLKLTVLEKENTKAGIKVFNVPEEQYRVYQRLFKLGKNEVFEKFEHRITNSLGEVEFENPYTPNFNIYYLVVIVKEQTNINSPGLLASKRIIANNNDQQHQLVLPETKRVESKPERVQTADLKLNFKLPSTTKILVTAVNLANTADRRIEIVEQKNMTLEGLQGQYSIHAQANHNPYIVSSKVVTIADEYQEIDMYFSKHLLLTSHSRTPSLVTVHNNYGKEIHREEMAAGANVNLSIWSDVTVKAIQLESDNKSPIEKKYEVNWESGTQEEIFLLE